MATFAKSKVIELIRENADVQHVYENRNGKDVYLLASGAIIRLPHSNKRIPHEEVEVIAEVKLGMGPWAFDYWIDRQK